MKISRQLIEKYHRGECSAEEQVLVEEWLFEDSFSEELALPPAERKEIHKQKIWEGIAPVLPGGDNAGKDKVSRPIPVKWISIAASIVLVAAGWYIGSGGRQHDKQNIIEANNLSDVKNRSVNADLYTLSLGPKSNVRIDPRQELMQFCGTLSFVPTEDVTLKIVGECPKGESPETVVNLKSGSNYIAFSYRNNTEETELIVVEQNQLSTLPEFIQKQLITLFKI